jgi:hypothetical protein
VNHGGTEDTEARLVVGLLYAGRRVRLVC